MKPLELIIENYILIYACSIFSLYFILSLLAYIGVKKYRHKNNRQDSNLLLDPENAPFVSIIAPAFNEEKTIIVNIRSLLTLNYPNFEVIIVNDGSHDNSLDLMIREFDLEKTDYYYIEKIKTKSFSHVYKSKKIGYSKLTVVDKRNTGAKSDALNVGINVSKYDHILCVDVDCVLERDVLLKMVKEMMDSTVNTIGVGASINLSNGCDVDVKTGEIKESRLSTCLLSLFQELEYLRSFMLGKMGWSLVNAVPNVSGALGLYHKKTVIEIGGYDTKTIAEDMDLVIRLAARMIENNQDYRIGYIPISGTWTEAPSNLKMLGRQRSRWASGLMQVLTNHRSKVLNYKYKNIGLLVLPTVLFFEFLAPIIEISGLIYFIASLFTDEINWSMALLVLAFSCSFGLLTAAVSIFLNTMVDRHLHNPTDKLKLFMLVFIEPLLYHPLIVYFSLRGFYKCAVSQKVEWGMMTRIGYKENSEIAVSNQ